MHRIASLLILPAALLASCVTEPPRANVQQIPANYRQQVAALLRSTLKDPYSVRDAMISQPIMVSGLLVGGTRNGACVRLNSRNSFGAYTGLETFTVAFVNGSTVGPYEGSCSGSDVIWSPLNISG